jgi:phosphoenolpyruvate carboxykinase (ATP)
LHIPTSCPDVPSEVLIPKNTWDDGNAYDVQAARLAEMFNENFKKFAEGTPDAITAAGPKVG